MIHAATRFLYRAMQGEKKLILFLLRQKIKQLKSDVIFLEVTFYSVRAISCY